jgi:hypothetical protein
MDDFWKSVLRIASVDVDTVTSGSGIIPVYVGDRRAGHVRIEKHGDQLKVAIPGGAKQEHLIQTKRIKRNSAIRLVCPKCRIPRERLYLTHASDRTSASAFECRGCAYKTMERLKTKRLVA